MLEAFTLILTPCDVSIKFMVFVLENNFALKRSFFKETNAKSIIFQTSACIRATHSLVRIPVGIYFQWKIFIYLTSLWFWVYRPFSVAPSSVLPSQSRSFLSRL